MHSGLKQLTAKIIQSPLTGVFHRYRLSDRLSMNLPRLLRGWSVPSPWFTTTDGYRLYSRLIRPDDAPLLLDFFEQLSPESRRRRFHMNVDHLSEEQKRAHAHKLAAVDNRTQGGAVVAVDAQAPGKPIVGVARLARIDASARVLPYVLAADPAAGDQDVDPQTVAEVALVVRDDFQGRGVGRALVVRLGPLARQMRLRRLVASIDADNRAALRLWRGLGLTTVTTTRHGETLLQIILPE